jgi:gas vesicle protein
MCKLKATLTIVGISLAIGGILGTLYAPEEGYETRKKLMRLKRKISCHGEDNIDDDRESLHELSSLLQKELNKINEKIERLGKNKAH